MQTKEKVKQVKGNIPLDNELLNKYENVSRIFNTTEKMLKENKKIKIYNIFELTNLDLSVMKAEKIKKLANKIFSTYHSINIFVNDNNKILVSKNGINESVQKIYNARAQRDLLKEHLIVFANLGIIIENSILVSQTLERKGRNEILYWNYYLDSLYIDDKLYVLEFEVRSMNNGQNQYRIQRLELSI